MQRHHKKYFISGFFFFFIIKTLSIEISFYISSTLSDLIDIKYDSIHHNFFFFRLWHNPIVKTCVVGVCHEKSWSWLVIINIKKKRCRYLAYCVQKRCELLNYASTLALYEGRKYSAWQRTHLKFHRYVKKTR